MRQRKMDYMAWLVFEVSKNWAEADADISEAVDFCRYYAAEIREIERPRVAAFARRVGRFEGGEAGQDGADGVADVRTHRLAVGIEAGDRVGALAFDAEDVGPAGVVAHQGPGLLDMVGHLGRSQTSRRPHSRSDGRAGSPRNHRFSRRGPDR